MILCCGEALIDMLPRETADGVAAFAPHPGGAVFNTAIALGRLGAPAGLLTGLSRDLFGQVLERALDASHVDHSLAVRSDRPTTLAFVTLTDGHARYAFYDENTAGRMLRPADLPAPGPGVQALFLGGISLVAEPCGSAYEAFLTDAAADRAVMIDPNIRPGFITDEPAYRARLERMIARADIVKLSDEDLRWLRGPGDVAAQVRDLIAAGPRVVIITEGARGATGYTSGLSVFVPAPSVTVADTVGAGDTFNAGFLCALHRTGMLDKTALAALPEATLRSALSLGAHAAAVTVSRAGANPPRADELAG
jgi:fructokinase